jgi:hypothetical protein
MRLLIEKLTNKVIFGTDNNTSDLYFSGSTLMYEEGEVWNIDSSLYNIIDDNTNILPSLFLAGYDYYNNGVWSESPDKMEMYSGSFNL